MELLKLDQSEIKQLEARKELAWGKYGKKLVEAEKSLQEDRMVLKKHLAEKPTKNNITDCQNLLNSSKSKLKTIIDIRKKYTNPIDDVKARLMEVEKDCKNMLLEYENSIISVKREIEVEKKKATAKVDEQQDYVYKLKQACIDLNDKIYQLINKYTQDSYFDMLDKKVAYDQFDNYVKATINGLKETLKLPSLKEAFANQNFSAKYNSKEELSEITHKGMIDKVNFFVELENNLLEKKAGYKSELANSEKAKEIAEKEAKEAEKKRLEQKQNAELESKISKAQDGQMVEDDGYKKLKKAYEVDMPNTHETALQLFACFSSCLDLVLPKLKVTKWMDFKPSQIAKVLGKLKSSDNSLEFTGINFKEIEKL